VRPFSADGRFFLLLSFAFAALSALAFAVPYRTPAEAANRATYGVDRVVLPSIPIEPVRPLESLWQTNLGSRFPSMKDVEASRFSILPDHQIVSYYGNPYTEVMGILGSGDPETIAAALERQAARYDDLNGPLGVMPAIHLVYAVAQPHPTGNGLYLQYVDDETVERYLQVAREHNMLLFLDLQIGRSTVDHEVSKVLKYLREPNVHLALDPEFAMDETRVPGERIGSITAADVNIAQAALQDVVIANNLPPKLLIVHQFMDHMVIDGDDIDHHEGVDLIIDVDGYGSSAVKRATYERYANRSYAAHVAIKLFFDYDAVVIYQ
jgi:hypothetical protein